MIKILKPKVLGATFVGAATGFATQHALTKIMFMPQRKVEVGGFEIPMEGLFSRYQTSIADTLDKTINAVLKNPNLLPPLQKTLTKPELKNVMFDFVVKFVYETGDKKTINEIISLFLNDKKKEELTKELKEFISKILIEKTDKEVLGSLMASEGIKIFREVTSGTILEKFMSERLFTSIANGISAAVHKFVETSATQKILDIVFNEMDSMMDKTIPELLKMLSLDEKTMRSLLETVYDAILLEIIPSLLDNVDFGNMAKSGVLKINVEKVYDFLNSKCSKAIIVLDSIAGLATGSISGIIALCSVK